MATGVFHFINKLFQCLSMDRVFSSVLKLWLNPLMVRGMSATPSGTARGGRTRMVVGLGNPGMERTRHSVGMAVVTALADHLGVAYRKDRSVCGDVIRTELHGSPLVLLRPRRLMNVSGVCVAKTAAKYGIQPENILLVHDELDKPLGKIAVKHGGSSRGHNGVRSCVEHLQTDVMVRLRVGIGRPAGNTPVERHVLSRFSSEEQDAVTRVLVQSVELLLLQLGPPTANQKPPCSPSEGRTPRNRKRAAVAPERPAEGPETRQQHTLSTQCLDS